jgi:Sel1 repeat-containing protein
LYFGGWGVPQDDLQAAKWFRKAADQGNAQAQSNLGLMYANGRATPKNLPEAAKWFRKAADQSDAEAQTFLGSLYVRGEGVSQDYIRAHMWFNLAAAQGHQKAIEARAELVKGMTSIQITEAQKLAREWKPSASTGTPDQFTFVASSDGCRKFASVDDTTLEPFMRWLAGYRDGAAAMAALDKRLADLPRDPFLLGALVLSSCHANPDRSIGEVANGVIEMFVNKQPGRRLNLGVPKQ